MGAKKANAPYRERQKGSDFVEVADLVETLEATRSLLGEAWRLTRGEPCGDEGATTKDKAQDWVMLREACVGWPSERRKFG